MARECIAGNLIANCQSWETNETSGSILHADPNT